MNTLRAWLEAHRDEARTLYLEAEHAEAEHYNRGRRDALDEVLAWLDGPPADHAPTVKFPPIRETVLRRPPPPAVRELTGPDLLRALADELEREGLTVDDLEGGDDL